MRIKRQKKVLDESSEAVIDDRAASALTSTEQERLRRALLGYFTDERKIQSAGLRDMEPFCNYPRRAVSGMLVAMCTSGLMTRSGARRNAAYQLTPLGQAAKDGLAPTD